MSSRRRRTGPGPFTAAGLVRFYEEVEEGIKLRPEIVVLTAIGITVLVILLNILLPLY